MRSAIDALKRGEVVATPTDTVWGLVCDARNERATEALRNLKGARPDRRFVLLVPTTSRAAPAARFDERAGRLAERFWPGPLTLVLATDDGGTVAVRVPAGDEVSALLAAVQPLASTSANPEGAPPARSPEEVSAYFGDRVTTVGAARLGGTASTIVNVSGSPAVVLRHGVVGFASVERALGERVAFSFRPSVLVTGSGCEGVRAACEADEPRAVWLARKDGAREPDVVAVLGAKNALAETSSPASDRTLPLRGGAGAAEVLNEIRGRLT